MVAIALFEPLGNLVHGMLGHPAALDTNPVNAAWFAVRMLIGALIWAYLRRWLPGSRPGGVIREALRPVADRWPTALALLITADQWMDGGPPTWLLLVIGSEHLVIGALRRSFPDRRTVWWHFAGTAAYWVAVWWAILADDPTLSAWILGIGWLLHAGWDAVLFHRRIVTWRWLCEACIVIDIVFGLVILGTAI